MPTDKDGTAQGAEDGTDGVEARLFEAAKALVAQEDPLRRQALMLALASHLAETAAFDLANGADRDMAAELISHAAVLSRLSRRISSGWSEGGTH